MRALILVDLDNVLGDEDVFELSKDARPRLQELRDSFAECVTAFAFNTVTAIEHGLTWEALERTARGFADSLDAARSKVEIALALPMPQTADVLLARLARHAPTEAAHGHYDLAALLSKDGDLQRDLGGEVFASEKSGWVQVARGWPFAAWAPRPGARPLVRRPPSPPRASGSEPVALSGAYTELVSRPTHAGWAASRATDLAPDLELVELSRRIEEDPWLLSQVGATRASLCGLSRLPPSAEPLGSVCAKDGLELRGDAPRPTRLSECESASVGIGAARFPGERATIGSRLPVKVLNAVGRSECDARGVMVRRVLQRLEVGAAVGNDFVEVQLRAAVPHLVAKVKHSSITQPAAWWLVGDAKACSEQRIEGAAGRLPISVRTTGVPCRTESGSRVRLALRCPLEPGGHVRCEAPIAQGTIGQAWWDPPHGKSRPIAVFAPRHVPATKSLLVEPIHSTDRGPSELRDLPLMVAR